MTQFQDLVKALKMDIVKEGEEQKKTKKTSVSNEDEQAHSPPSIGEPMATRRPEEEKVDGTGGGYGSCLCRPLRVTKAW